MNMEFLDGDVNKSLATNNEMSHIGKSPRVHFFIHRLILNPVLFPIFV